MAAYQAGNEPAFEKLFDRYAGRVYGFLVRRLGDPSLAEELYQEAFLRLHRARQTYDPSRPFRAWMFSIAHNLLNDALRSRRRSPEIRALDEASPTLLSAENSGAPAADSATIASLDASPEKLVARGAGSSAQPLAELASVRRGHRADPGPARGSVLRRHRICIGRSAPATKQLAYRALQRIRAELVSGGHREGP